MPPRHSTRSAAVARSASLVALALAAVTCRDGGPVGPGLPTQASLAIAPRIERAAAAEPGASFLALHLLRGTLTPVGGGAPYSVDATFDGDTATLAFDVTFPGPTQRYTLTLAAMDTAGDTLFRSMREVTATSGANTPVQDTLRYVAPDSAVAWISLAAADTMILGVDTLAVTATGYDRREQAVSRLYIGWSSRDTTVARVVASGSSSAKLIGRDVDALVWIVGRAFNGAADSLQLRVAVRIGSVVISSDTLRTVVGGSVAADASVLDLAGTPIDRAVTWSSLDTTVATVRAVPIPLARARSAVATAARIMVTGVGEGSARIVATSGSRSDTSVVLVGPAPVFAVYVFPESLAVLAGGRARLTVEAHDIAGNVLAGRATTWSSSDSTVARVGADGIVAGVSPGNATITASVEGITGTAAVRVDSVAPAPIARTFVSPSSVALTALGAATRLTAQSRAADSSLVEGSYGWRVSGGDTAKVVTVDTAGVVTALATGSAYVVATEAGGTADSALVTVTQLARSVVMSKGLTVDALGVDVVLHAQALDSLGNVVPGATLAWVVKDTTIAAIVLAGGDSAVVQTIGNGSTQVVASTDGAAGATDITVGQVAATLRLSPDVLHLGIEGRAQVTATLLDGNGWPMTLKPGETIWSTEGQTGVADVDSTGEVHAKLSGTTAVFATARGLRSGTVNVDVSDANPLVLSFGQDSLVMEQDSARVAVFLSAGQLQQPVTVVLTDSAGMVKPASDTLVFEPGQARHDVTIYAAATGTTTLTVSDAGGKLYAPARMVVRYGKGVILAAPAVRPASVGGVSGAR